MKVCALRTTDVNPHILLQTMQKDVDQFETLYVVAIDKEGEPLTYATGDLNTLPYAALVLQNLALMHLNGNLIQE